MASGRELILLEAHLERLARGCAMPSHCERIIARAAERVADVACLAPGY